MFKNRPAYVDYILIVAGAFLMGFAIKNMYDPVGLVTGGVSGIAIIVKSYTGIPLWVTNTVLNLPLFAVSWKLQGFRFIKRTAVATAALSLSLYILPEMPVVTGDMFLAGFFGGIVSGAGTGLVFLMQATTGGTDMLAALLQRRLKQYSIAQIMQVLDGLVVLAGAGVFGMTSALYACVAIFMVTRVSDGILEGMKFSKQALIISDRSDEIAQAILVRMERGVTAVPAVGMYSGKERKMLFCVVSRKEIVRIRELVWEMDPKAFVIMSDVREVLGEGFLEY